MIKANKAITLIALIITIIVLLILAGVTINMVLGENGLINKAKTAVGKYENAQEMEKNEFKKHEDLIDSINGTRDVDENRIKELIREVLQEEPKEKNDSEYHPGDSITYNYIICNGYFTNSKKEISFSLKLGKNISSDVKNITFSSTNFYPRCAGVYIMGDGNGQASGKGNIASYFNIVYYANNDIEFRYTSPSTLNGTNNSAMSLAISNLVINFN